MKTITLPPYAPVLMESTRAIGYSVEAAVAELIDNSIAAKASIVDIDFFPIGKAYVSLFDNGSGMDKDTPINAMQYGSRNPLDIRDENDLLSVASTFFKVKCQNIINSFNKII